MWISWRKNQLETIQKQKEENEKENSKDHEEVQKLKEEVEKKQLGIFTAVAYGITFLMGILMWYGSAKGLDISAFPNAQMFYPAAGVMLAYLLTKKEDVVIPRGFYIAFCICTAVLMLLAIVSVFVPIEPIQMQGMTISVWTLIVQYVMILGSVVCWILYGVAGKQKRRAYGLSWNKGIASWLMIGLFILLYMLRTVVSCLMSGAGALAEFGGTMLSTTTLISIISMPVNFFLVFVAFFGEEYGWRYYLQPLLQKKFGLRGGVLVLGVVWGLWHLPIDFFYYTSVEMGLIAAVSQQIICITLGIFFAYAYMKTGNIWVPVVLHFLNNNLIPVITGNYSTDVLENQQYSWAEVPIALLLNGVFFGLFILAKEFRGNSKKQYE